MNKKQKRGFLRRESIFYSLVFVFSIIGLCFSIVLTKHFYEIRSGVAGFKSFCHFNQTMNCDQVAASRFSEVFLGIPISSVAAGWYLSFFFIACIALRSSWRREGVFALFLMSGFGVFCSLVYFYIMSVVLKTFCLFCLGIDFVNISLFFLTWKIKRKNGGRAFFQNLLKWKVFFGVFLVCLFSSVVGFRFLESLNSISSESADLNQWVDSILKTTPVFLKTDSHLPSFGPIDAPITIVEFSDYQCPYCRVAAFRLNTIMQRYSGKIRVIFKNYPLDQACNKHWAVTKHPAACEASRISYCAHLQGKFQEVYEELFEKQSQIVSGHVLPLLTPLGFSFEKIQEIQKCSGDLETTKIINEEIEEATLLGVQGTPTFFINGHKMEGLYPILVWNKIIEYLLL